MAYSIDEAVKEVLPLSRGRFRFRLIVEGLNFYSEPLSTDKFLETWEVLADHKDLSSVQYESKSEYTPGNYIWQTF